MLTILRSLPIKIGFGLGLGLVALAVMLSESQGADDPRASLRAPSSTKRSASEEQLARQATRLRRLVREQIREQKDDASAEPFARTRAEAEAKLLAAMIKENNGVIEPPQTSLASIGLCDEGLKESETAKALEAIKPSENLSRHLSVDWSMDPDEEQGHRALEKALGRDRYLEVARSCAAKEGSAVKRETESAFLLISKELGLNDSASRKALELLAARDRELSALDPEPLAALDANGKLASSRVRSAKEMAALQQKQNVIESRYTTQFKKLIGESAWRKYKVAVLGTPGTSTDLYWAQYLLFREAPAPAAATATKANATPARPIKLIPNKF